MQPKSSPSIKNGLIYPRIPESLLFLLDLSVHLSSGRPRIAILVHLGLGLQFLARAFRSTTCLKLLHRPSVLPSFITSPFALHLILTVFLLSHALHHRLCGHAESSLTGWKVINTHLLQIAERCGLGKQLQVVYTW